MLFAISADFKYNLLTYLLAYLLNANHNQKTEGELIHMVLSI